MSIRTPYRQAVTESPQSVNICLTCTRPTCSGNCEAFPKQAPPPSRAHCKTYEYNGESHTLPEWSALLGIPYSTLKNRIRSGMTFAIALQHGVTGRRNVRRYAIGGESHTLKEWSDISGVPYQTIVGRLHKGLDIASAIGQRGAKCR